MPKSSNQKLKLLYLIKLFTEKTDESHFVTMADILAYLAANDINAERKSIYDDIALLNFYGFDIETRQENKKFYYYLVSREFELAEVKLLVDLVQSSKFLTAKKSDELIRKLEKLASNYEAGELQRHVFVTSRVKAANEGIYYNVDAINKAINSNSQISFEYYEWGVDKKLKKRINGDKTGISPWTLIWDDENYYMVAYDGADEKMKHYRVDKMRNISLTGNARLGRREYGKKNPAQIARQVFGMYGGEEENVAIEFPNSLVGVVMDRFGKDVMLVPKGNERFVIHVQVEVSSQFIAWIIGLGAGVKVLSPENVVERLREEGQRLLQQYSE